MFHAHVLRPSAPTGTHVERNLQENHFEINKYLVDSLKGSE